jgi:hypothetical protein
MKKLIILLFGVATLFAACDKDDDVTYAEIREIAWNSLSSQEKSTVTVDWNEAPVNTVVYNSKKAYSVTFQTNLDELLGPIVIYIDRNTLKIVGQNARD